ncbi:hypothetical protein [Vibrio sonorensis]|uniref:hypothetical protein n=1 Tax=Vibrio sonorensis TaxID=1004316 RepID=UPI0008D96ECF|nr:hypothetical protein [Vibrio sonorensis]
MKLFTFFLISVVASSCSFVIHVATVEWLPSWVATQMEGLTVQPSWNVRFVALLTAVEYGIAASLLYVLARERLITFGRFNASLILGVLLAALHGAFIRQPLMDWVVGNPIHVVIVQNAFQWLVWLLMAVVVVFGLERSLYENKLSY